MNIFFDMDYTLFGMDGSLRPGALEVFEQLVERGHHIYIWSGMGARPEEVRRSGLEPFVKGVFRKPLTDFRAGLELHGVPVVPDFVIDDYPEIVAFFGGVHIREYISRHQQDAELYAILAQIDAHPAISQDSPLSEA